MKGYKTYSIFLFLSCICFNSIAQNWTVTNTGDIGKAVGVDKNGNVYSYVFGYPPVDFGDTVCNEGRIFLSKYNSNGQRQWLTEIKASWANVGDMLVDNNGSIYLTGVFNDSIVIADTILYYAVVGSNDLFLAKFNTDGVLQWARRSNTQESASFAGGTNTIFFSGFGSEGDVQIIIHNLYYLMVIGNDTLFGDEGSGNNFVDHALVRFDTSGNVIWTKKVYNQDYDFKPIHIEPSGDFYLTGTVTIGMNTWNYLEKFDSADVSTNYDYSMSYLWVQYSDGFADGFGKLVRDEQNNIYVHVIDSSIHWIKKYDSNGNLIWGKTLNYFISSYSSIGIDKQGNIVVNGGKGGMPAALYFAKYDSSGKFIGNIYLARKTDSTTDYVYSYDITLDDVGNIYVTGDYWGDTSASIIFIDDTFSLIKGGGVFVSKFHSSQLDTTPLGIVNIIFADASLMLNAYPNPFADKITLMIKGDAKEELNISIHNLFGQIVYSEEIQHIEQPATIEPDLHSLPAGIYFFQVKTKNKFLNLKIIKQ